MANVLVVDDDPEQVRLRRQVLEMAGHGVWTACEAAAATALLDEVRPDVLLMDLCLPKLQDGLGLIRTARAQAPATRIVVLSGWPEELYDLPEAKFVANILIKPTRIAALLDAIRAAALALLLVLLGAGAARAQSFRFDVDKPGEVVAELEMSSPGADWSKPGREAALAVLTVDNRAVQHVMLWAGEKRYTYAAFLGALSPGGHELRIARDPRNSARDAGLNVWNARFRTVARDDPGWQALAHAPILYARADTVGAFTDVPLIAYCEKLRESGRPYLQYTVIFSNEDGGTSTRALMARWGRTTDIEYIYRAWLNASGEVDGATIQSKDHKEIPFRGRREGSHPVLIPFTHNNMVSGEGTSAIRYQLPPEMVDLSAHSREEVMDAHPLTYRVAAQEMEREGKLRPFGVVDGQKAGDPRNYLTMEMNVTNRTSAVAALARLRGETVWRSGNLGRADYAVSRDGWVRTTIELPPGTTPQQIEEFAFACVVPPAKPDPIAGTCRIDAVSKMFFLGPDYTPGAAFWRLDGPVELPSGLMRVFPVSAPARSLP